MKLIRSSTWCAHIIQAEALFACIAYAVEDSVRGVKTLALCVAGFGHNAAHACRLCGLHAYNTVLYHHTPAYQRGSDEVAAAVASFTLSNCVTLHSDSKEHSLRCSTKFLGARAAACYLVPQHRVHHDESSC